MEPGRSDATWAVTAINEALGLIRNCTPCMGGSQPAIRLPRDPAVISNPSPRLTVVLDGVCRHALSRRGERSAFPGRPGDALFLAPDAWNVRLADEPTRFLGLVFARGWLRILENLHPGGPRTRPALHWHHAAPLTGAGVAIIDALTLRAEPGGDPGAIDTHLVRALLLAARDQCLSAREPTPADGSDARAGGRMTWQAVVEYLHDHAHDPSLSRDGVARRFRIHPSHLSDLCSRWGGGGFHAALETIRLERARRLLAGGDAPVAEVMRLCGYADPGTGIRAFRRVTGTTPGVFRRLRG